MHSRDPWRVMQSAPPFVQSVLPIAPNGRRGSYGPRARVGSELKGTFNRRVTPHLRGVWHERKGLLAELAPILAPASGGVTFTLDLDDATGLLQATVCVDGQCYDAALDLSGVIACAMEKARQFHHELHEEMADRPLVGGHVAIPHFANGYTLVGADCGTRVYQGVTQRVLAEIIRAVAAQGMTITGKNPFDVDTHQMGITLKATWDPASISLALSVDGPGLLCDKAWEQIDPTLKNVINQAAGSAMLLTDVDAAVHVAGEALVDACIDHHCNTICGGWWGDIERDVKKAVNSVEKDAKGVVHTVEHTVTELAPLIEKALPLAANAIFPGAGALASSIMNAATGSGSLQQVAQSAVNTAQQAAANDPNAAALLQAAQQAVATTTAATHVAKTAAQAATGNAAAQQQIQQMASSAAQGDPAAQQAMALANQAGSMLSSSPDQLAQAAVNMAGAGGAMQDASNASNALANAPADIQNAVSQAISGWFSSLEHDVADVAKYATPEGWAVEGIEALEGGHHKKHHEHVVAKRAPVASPAHPETITIRPDGGATVSGAPSSPYERAAREAIAASPHSTAYGVRRRRGVESVLLFPSVDDGIRWVSNLDPDSVDYAAVFDGRRGTPQLVSQLLPGGHQASEAEGREYADALTGPQDDAIVGAAATALDGLRQRASDVAVEVHTNTGHDVVAVVIHADGTASSSTYPNSDAADDAFGMMTRGPFAYAAYYDAGDMTWPGPLNEAVGGGPVVAVPGTGIHRGVATTGA